MFVVCFYVKKAAYKPMYSTKVIVDNVCIYPEKHWKAILRSVSPDEMFRAVDVQWPGLCKAQGHLLETQVVVDLSARGVPAGRAHPLLLYMVPRALASAPGIMGEAKFYSMCFFMVCKSSSVSICYFCITKKSIQ